MRPEPTTPPPMPDDADNVRVAMLEPMVAVLDEDWEDVAAEYMGKFVDPEVLATWGPPDTSDNVYSDMATELASPGHYTQRWAARNSSRRANRLTKPGGLLDKAGYASRMTYVERMAWGLGEMFVHVLASSGDELQFEAVDGRFIYAEGSPKELDVPHLLWHLRHRYIDEIRHRLWCWDVYDIRDPDQPSLKVVAGESFKMVQEGVGPVTVIESGTDLTETVLGRTFEGDDYAWRRLPDGAQDVGAPVIPYAAMRTVDSGKMWNYTTRYGSFKATLVLSQASTYVMHAARDASGSTIIVTGVGDPSTSAQNIGQKDSPRVLSTTPGSILRLPEDPNSKAGPKVTPVGPGTNLQALSMWLQQLRARAAQRFGVAGADAVRNDANPTSASALLITEKSKMAATRAADELFRRFDRRVMMLCSVVLRAWGVEVPEDGYTIQYYHPDPTPAEMKEQREQEVYDVEQGYRSKVQVYMDQHPGTTREDAIRALAQVQRDEMLLSARIESMLNDAAGISTMTLDADDVQSAVEELQEVQAVAGALLESGQAASDEQLRDIAEGVSEVVSMLTPPADVEVE